MTHPVKFHIVLIVVHDLELFLNHSRTDRFCSNQTNVQRTKTRYASIPVKTVEFEIVDANEFGTGSQPDVSRQLKIKQQDG